MFLLPILLVSLVTTLKSPPISHESVGLLKILKKLPQFPSFCWFIASIYKWCWEGEIFAGDEGFGCDELRSHVKEGNLQIVFPKDLYMSVGGITVPMFVEG